MDLPVIATIASEIHKLIQELQTVIDAKTDATSNTLFGLLQDLGRFRVWSENIGAHRRGRVSLDYRLRNAARLRQTVVTLLSDLKGSVQHILDIVNGSRLPYDEENGQESETGAGDDEAGSEAGMTGTEMEMLHDEVLQIVDHLYNFTIHIRSIARPRDLQRKAAKIDVSYFESYDVQHVRQMFPLSEEELVYRLGKANTRRRQIFKYLEIHHWKLAKRNDKSPKQQIDQQAAIDTAEDPFELRESQSTSGSDYARTAGATSTTRETFNTQTTITTVAGDYLQVDVDDSNSEISSSLSESSGSEEGPSVPELPAEGIDRKAFECSYCFEIIRVSGTKSWMKHVIRDLQPYICTFGDCPQSSLMFSSSQEWFEHELEFHRGPALDNSDISQYTTRNDSSQFYNNQRGARPDHVPSMIMFRPAPKDLRVKGTCPLCLREEVMIRSHLSNHLQTIALFSLPRVLPGNPQDVTSDRALEWDSQAELQSLGEDIDLAEDEEAEGITTEGGEEDDEISFENSSTQIDSAQVGGRWTDFDLTKSQEGHAPLLNAASSGNSSLVQFLLAEPNTNIEIRDNQGRTPLSRAAELGATEVVEVLVRVPGIDINTRDRVWNRTPLNWAAGNGHAKVVHILLQCPTIDPNIGDRYQRSPIWRASIVGHIEVVRELAAYPGVDFDVADRYGRTPIAWAGAGNHVDIMKILSTREVDLNYRDSEGVAPLARAATAGSLDAVRFLLEFSDVIIDLEDETGRTAMVRAYENGHYEISSLLLQHGASSTDKDRAALALAMGEQRTGTI